MKISMDVTFEIEEPEDAFFFSNELEFHRFKEEFEAATSLKISEYPDKYPCVGFSVHTNYLEDLTYFGFLYIKS